MEWKRRNKFNFPFSRLLASAAVGLQFVHSAIVIAVSNEKKYGRGGKCNLTSARNSQTCKLWVAQSNNRRKKWRERIAHSKKKQRNTRAWKGTLTKLLMILITNRLHKSRRRDISVKKEYFRNFTSPQWKSIMRPKREECARTTSQFSRKEIIEWCEDCCRFIDVNISDSLTIKMSFYGRH